MDFEKNMTELENIAKQLESGSISLDKSLELFDKGIKLVQTCRKMLDEAEKKVSVLVSDGEGGLKEKDFINEAE